jgi:hypothetical protein|tara:strand:+ start:688 stop:903 length:216 start_codon:yes stop_codon:yes gene_type:complete
MNKDKIIKTKKTILAELDVDKKAGLIIMTELERNLLKMSLEYMEEHLDAIKDQVDVTEKLIALTSLKQAIK